MPARWRGCPPRMSRGPRPESVSGGLSSSLKTTRPIRKGQGRSTPRRPSGQGSRPTRFAARFLVSSQLSHWCRSRRQRSRKPSPKRQRRSLSRSLKPRSRRKSSRRRLSLRSRSRCPRRMTMCAIGTSRLASTRRRMATSLSPQMCWRRRGQDAWRRWSTLTEATRERCSSRWWTPRRTAATSG